jgi:hypothetical protein
MLRNGLLAVVLMVAGVVGNTVAVQEEGAPSESERIKVLEEQVRELTDLTVQMQGRLDKQDNAIEQVELTSVSKELSAPVKQSGNLPAGLRLGGYGEIHANFQRDSDGDQVDFHRVVGYLGYDFAEWIKFHSELELEHAFAADSGDGSHGGEFILEQAYFDFLFGDLVNVRAGRVLTPLGIVNKKHEPTTFNGVERPSFAKYIIPTTWSSDGIGIFGNLAEGISYEGYVVGGLDGSGFSAKDGIRGGRIKERASLNDPAVTGRLDFWPLLGSEKDHDLRIGVSGYFGGLDNSNKGRDSGIDGDISIYSADFEYSVNRWDFRGAVAQTIIDGAKEIGNGTAEEIFGWYAEAGYHIWPETWKKGRFANSDAVVFGRYDNFDTQYEMPKGVARDKADDREEWTFGMNFFATRNLVLKADYQMSYDGNGDGSDRYNLGIGWAF